MEAMAPWGRSDSIQGDLHIEGWTSGKVEAMWPVLVGGPCTSSMDLAWRLSANDLLPSWGSVLAVSQQSGRGQMRREWCSPPGNLYAAWLWPGLPRQWDRLASLLAGFILCRTLQAYEPRLLIKWPNDLLLGEHKVGGVLVEEREGRLLIGFGLNLASAPGFEAMRTGTSVRAGLLDSLCRGFGPLQLWLRMLGPAVSELNRLLAGDPVEFLRAMEHILAWRGLQIQVKESGEHGWRGTIVGLTDDGGLRLAGVDGEQVLYSGSILPLY